MRRRRRHEDDPDNHDRWLVSYADFITLLFAFFVVMYALSSVNEGKYRVLSSAMLEAFRSGDAVSIVQQNPSGSANTMIAVPNGKPVANAVKTHPQIVTTKPDPQQQQERQKLADIATHLQQAVKPLESQGQVRVIQSAQGIAIEIRDSALYPSGQATLSPQSQQVLAQVAEILKQVDNLVKVEGHTDNIPIKNGTFPSNWELSAARAGSVVRLLQENGVAGNRLEAIGRADNRPIADNTALEGRARNRRVEINILSHNSDEVRELPLAVLTPPAPPAAQERR